MRRLALFLGLLLCFAARSGAQTFVQSQQNTTASGTAVTVTISSSSNNLLIIATQESLNNTSTVAITDSSGGGTWTQTASGYSSNGTTNRLAIWVKPNSAAVTSVTATWSGGLTAVIEAVVFEVSGMVTLSAEDSSVNSSQSATTTATSGALTTTNANDILVFALRVSGAFTSPAAGGGYTLPANATSTRMFMIYKIVSVTQSAVTTTATWTNSLNDANVFAGFKALAASGPNVGLKGKTGFKGKIGIT